LVQQHHPTAGETEIRRWLNQAMLEFGRKTRILKSAYQFPSVSGQRWYGFEESILEVLRVDYDGYTIKRLVGNPNLKDLI